MSTTQPIRLLVVFALLGGAFLLSFLTFFHEDYGIHRLPQLPDHLGVLWTLAPMALGAALLIPTIVVGLISVFPSKRNPRTRRNIYTGWAGLVIAVELLTLARLL